MRWMTHFPAIHKVLQECVILVTILVSGPLLGSRLQDPPFVSQCFQLLLGTLSLPDSVFTSTTGLVLEHPPVKYYPPKDLKSSTSFTF